MRVLCRFCCNSESLPPVLQSSSVENRPHGLRTRVVRALFHVYRPLSERVPNHSSHSSLFQADPQKLVGLRCILAWQERSAKPNWKFYFKFRRGSGRRGCTLLAASSSNRAKSVDRLLSPTNVFHNPDESCVILLVTSRHFLPLPLVMGQILVKASITGCIFTQSMQLHFSSVYIQPGRSQIASSVIAKFDAFISAHILHWWHPQYPHKH